MKRAGGAGLVAVLYAAVGLLGPPSASAQTTSCVDNQGVGVPCVGYFGDATTSAASGPTQVGSLSFDVTVPGDDQCVNRMLFVSIALLQETGSVGQVGSVAWDPSGGSAEPLTRQTGACVSSGAGDDSDGPGPNTGNRKRVEMWTLLSPTPGTSGTVVVTMSGANTAQIAAGAILACNVDQTDPFVSRTNRSATNPSDFIHAGVPSAKYGLLVDVLALDGNVSFSIGTGIGGDKTTAWQQTTGSSSSNLRGAANYKAQTDGAESTWYDLSARTYYAYGVMTIKPAATTAVTLESFSADASDGGGVALRWHSGYEADTLGYRVYRESTDGTRVPVSRDLIVGSGLAFGNEALEAGYSYAWWDEDGRPGDTYWLEEIELGGGRRMHGPYVARAATGFASARPPARSRVLGDVKRLATQGGARDAGARGLGGLSSWSTASAKAVGVTTMRGGHRLRPADSEQQWRLAAEDTAKITVDRPGWYRVGFNELTAAGFDVSDPERLQLYAAGQEQPILLHRDERRIADGFEFLGIPEDTLASGSRVYWLSESDRPGLRVQTSEQPWPGPGSVQSTPFTVEIRERTVYIPGLLNGDAENFFGQAISTSPATYTVGADHLAPGTQSHDRIEVQLQSLTDDPYAVNVAINGIPVGAIELAESGHRAAVFVIPGGVLVEGDNAVVLSSDSDDGVAVVDRVELTYRRTTSAGAGQMALSLSRDVVTGPLRIDGFANSRARLVDVSRRDRPREIVTSAVAVESGHAVDVDLAPSPWDTTLLAFTDDQVLKPAAVETNVPSTWHEPYNGADMLIVTPRSFHDAVDPLRAFHESRGLATEVVDIEDIFDEFSYGSKDPAAIRALLERARRVWRTPPRFVLLVGDASYDPRDYLGYGDDLVPTRLVDTAKLETASDDWLADFDGDGAPEMAVGRLPVGSAVEASQVVAKVVAHEAAARPLERALMVADAAIRDNFQVVTKRLLTWFPSAVSVSTVAVDEVGVAEARQQVLDALREGVDLVNYSGHGTVDRWRGELLTVEDAPMLGNGDRLPLFTMMNCLNGLFHEPLLEGIGEVLVRQPEGGAAAVWASDARTSSSLQEMLVRTFYVELFSRPNVTIGEAAMAAKARVDDLDTRRSWILLGDPAMVVRPTQQ